MAILLMSACSYDQSSKDIDFVRGIEITKLQCKTSDIKAKALEFSLNPKGPVPKEIASIPLFSTLENDIRVSSEGTNAILFYAGGPLHEGVIVVFSDSHPSDEFKKGLAGTTIPWEQGVYFWAEWKVRKMPREFRSTQ